nr:uncharacterized protein LOC104111632 [Nicotiana tomentosiformis]
MSLFRHLLISDSAEITPANITANINSIPMLNGTNFKSWKKNLNIVLGVMDLNFALRVDSPPPLTDKSTSNEKGEMERWERSDRMYMMIMKKAIPEGTMSDKVKTAKEFMTEIEKVFVKSEKAEIDNIREYSMQMSHLTSKFKALMLDFYEDLLVHLILISLPPKFSQFKGCLNYPKPDDGERYIYDGDEFVTGCESLDKVERILKLFCDNKLAVLYSNNNRSSVKSKHNDIKFLVVKERIQSG